MLLRPDRFCNLVYAWTVKRVENRAEFDTDLLAPLPGAKKKVNRPSEVELAREGDEFMSFMAAMTGQTA